MENGNLNNNGNNANNGQENGVTTPEQTQTGIQKAMSKIQRGWHKFSTTKGGRWAIRCTKIGLLAFGAKTVYDKGFEKGKNSVEPTIVYATSITDGTDNQDIPAEESNNEQPAEE